MGVLLKWESGGDINRFVVKPNQSIWLSAKPGKRAPCKSWQTFSERVVGAILKGRAKNALLLRKSGLSHVSQQRILSHLVHWTIGGNNFYKDQMSTVAGITDTYQHNVWQHSCCINSQTQRFGHPLVLVSYFVAAF